MKCRLAYSQEKPVSPMTGSSRCVDFFESGGSSTGESPDGAETIYLTLRRKSMNPISNSVFEIFKTGPGPSSSHTIGPMLAAGRFLKKLSAVSAEKLPVEIHFYGSLALTGKGHGSDRAAAGGLLGMVPETCDTTVLSALLADDRREYEISLPRGTALVSGKRIFFH